MLTWGELISRETPCGRCRGTFRVPAPLDEAALAEVRRLLELGQGVSAIQLIRKVTGSGLRDAKRIYEHVTIFRGKCRQCGKPLAGSVVSDCAGCQALNIDA